nr:MAG TPA: hypothetical protein [Caudoviricetes sp.]
MGNSSYVRGSLQERYGSKQLNLIFILFVHNNELQRNEH